MARAEVRTCEVCGQKFDGYSTSRYCRECRLTVEKERKAQALAAFRAAEAAAKAKQLGEKLDREMKQKERREKQTGPNTEQCEGCFHWRRISGFDMLRACHYILDTGHCWERDGDKCLSKSSEMENPPTPIW